MTDSLTDRPPDRKDIDEGTGEDPNQLRKEELVKIVNGWWDETLPDIDTIYRITENDTTPHKYQMNLGKAITGCLKEIHNSKYNYTTAEIWEEISEQFGCKECGEFYTQYFLESI